MDDHTTTQEDVLADRKRERGEVNAVLRDVSSQLHQLASTLRNVADVLDARSEREAGEAES
jgi:hypothetical protein